MPVVRRWPQAALALVVAGLVLGFVAARTSLLQPHGLAVDQAIAADLRTSFGTTVMLAVGAAFSPVAGVLVVIVWSGLLLFWRHRPVAAVSTALVVAVGWGSSLLVKAIVQRDRPPSALVHSLSPETGATSYPSGHVALAFSLATAAWFLARGTRRSRLVATCGVLVVGLVAFSRLYLGAHYPGDVVGSVLISSGAIIALTGVWHGVIVDRIGSIRVVSPLLARFGPLTAPVGDAHAAPAATRRTERRTDGS